MFSRPLLSVDDRLLSKHGECWSLAIVVRMERGKMLCTVGVAGDEEDDFGSGDRFTGIFRWGRCQSSAIHYRNGVLLPLLLAAIANGIGGGDTAGFGEESTVG
ncbi:hypothetical protein ACLOJK_039202 [Asimina triloba]